MALDFAISHGGRHLHHLWIHLWVMGHESFGGMGMENQPSVDDFLCFS